MKKNKYIGCILVIMLNCMLAGCASEQTQRVPLTVLEDVSDEDTSSEDPEMEEADNAPDYSITISTEYGDLYYPDQWTEFVRISQEMNGDELTVTFEAEINENIYSLFEVIIGGDSETAMGQIVDESGITRNVTITANEIAVTSDLTEGEINRLYAMQEDINYVLDNLQ